MDAGARSPAELETLLEDAVLLADADAVARLFEPDGVVVSGPGHAEVRGPAAIAELGWGRWGYVADPLRIACSGDLALVVGFAAVHVARRGDDGSWRFAISVHG